MVPVWSWATNGVGRTNPQGNTVICHCWQPLSTDRWQGYKHTQTHARMYTLTPIKQSQIMHSPQKHFRWPTLVCAIASSSHQETIPCLYYDRFITINGNTDILILHTYCFNIHTKLKSWMCEPTRMSSNCYNVQCASVRTFKHYAPCQMLSCQILLKFQATVGVWQLTPGPHKSSVRQMGGMHGQDNLYTAQKAQLYVYRQ